jgi:3-hydroxybutyrate dehydrogenase
LVERQIEAIAERESTDIDAAARRLLADKQPSLEFVTPEAVGSLAAYLCSDAARQITGAALSIDGGWTAQ